MSTRLEDCDTPHPQTHTRINQGHLGFKIPESSRFKKQFSPNSWILANSDTTELDHIGPSSPTAVCSAAPEFSAAELT